LFTCLLLKARQMPDPDNMPYALNRLPEAEAIARSQGLAARLKQRRTCRWFSPAPVPRAIIEAAIGAAGSAPSGANHQPWHFAVITAPAMKRAIRDAAEAEERRFYGADGQDPKASAEWLAALRDLGTDAVKPFLEVAPYLIVVFSQRKGGIAEDGVTQNYYVNESVGIACGLLLATLHEAGVATLTHTPSPMGFLRDICQRPEWEKPVMIVVVGYPAADATVPSQALIKKPLDQITSWL
jgi:iodotyrosine deiodinase